MKRLTPGLTRRGLLAATTAGTGALFVRRGQAAPLPWPERVMRWAQVAFVENDPATYDPAFWIDYLLRTRADGICLSAGGIVAFYPTQVPLHHRSAWMKTGDPFGELASACRKLGMAVIARIDPHAARQAVRDAHPDWICVGPDGKPMRHPSHPDLWLTCALGDYNFQFMTAVAREIATRYDVDGLFGNRWDGQPICHCGPCRKSFRAATGLDLPAAPQGHAPAQTAYRGWRQQRLMDLWTLWDGEIRKVRPAARFIGNAGASMARQMDLTVLADRADILFSDRQARHGTEAPWSNGRHAKMYRSVMGDKPVGGIFSVGLEDRHRWKDSVQSDPEIRIWVADGVANGLRPWFTKFNATVIDRRWMKTVEELYQRFARWEPYLRNQAPLARVALLHSQQSAWHQGPEGDAAALGMYQALVEARVPFEMVHEQRLAQASPRYKLLVLANATALSDAQCQQIEAFVQAGGSVLATDRTSLFDSQGQPRSDFGLARLFGVSYGGQRQGPMKNAYIAFNHSEGPHPILAGLADAPRMIHGVHRLQVTPRERFPSPLLLVPPYPDLPMEDVFPRVPTTTTREVYLRQVGRGRVVYFPWDIDSTLWEVGSVDHQRVLANAVAWAMQEPQPVRVDGPGLLEVTAWRQRSSMTVHLINLNNPFAQKGPLRELLPAGPYTVDVRVPEGRSVRRVRLLAADVAPRVQKRSDALRVTVPRVLDHEIVALDLA